MSVVIEPMRSDDAAACGRIEAELFAGDGPWPESAFRAELAAPQCRYVVARTDSGAVIGYAGIALLDGPHPESEVHTIGVDSRWQGQGWGRTLLAEILAVADVHGGPVHLEVRTDNEAALNLYRRSGFHVVGTRKRYYHSGADAYTMTRPARARIDAGESGS